MGYRKKIWRIAAISHRGCANQTSHVAFCGGWIYRSALSQLQKVAARCPARHVRCVLFSRLKGGRRFIKRTIPLGGNVGIMKINLIWPETEAEGSPGFDRTQGHLLDILEEMLRRV